MSRRYILKRRSGTSTSFIILTRHIYFSIITQKGIVLEMEKIKLIERIVKQLCTDINENKLALHVHVSHKNNGIGLFVGMKPQS